MSQLRSAGNAPIDAPDRICSSNVCAISYGSVVQQGLFAGPVASAAVITARIPLGEETASAGSRNATSSRTAAASSAPSVIICAADQDGEDYSDNDDSDANKNPIIVIGWRGNFRWRRRRRFFVSPWSEPTSTLLSVLLRALQKPRGLRIFRT